MKKTLWVVVLFMVVGIVMSFGEVIEIRPRAIIVTPEQPSDLEIRISMNKPEGSVYQPGENIQLNFRSNKDAYVVIYNTRADGVTNIIFPNRLQTDNRVRAGQNYTIPTRGYNLSVSEPRGINYVQIVASTSQFATYNTWTQQFEASPFPLVTRDAQAELATAIQRIIIVPDKPEPEWNSAMTFFYVGSAPPKGTVDFMSSPSGANIWLDGSWVGSTPLKTTVFEGYHIVRFFLPGYQTFEREFYMAAGGYANISAQLVPLAPPSQPARLTVNSSPSGARVFLNGEFRGTSPITLNGISPGSHNVRLTLSGYQDFQTSITLSSGEHRTMNVNLQRDMPRDGTVRIQTNPRDARVTINGVDYGPANGEMTMSLPAGTHSLSVSRSGFNPASMSFSLAAGEYKTIPVNLTPLQATVSIRSNPSGATIHIDGTNTFNQTPFQMTLSPGTYQIRLTRSGFKDWTTTVTLSSGTNPDINASLAVLTGRLNITTNVSGTLYVDGRSRGNISANSQVAVELDEGIHEVLIVAPGYFSYITRVNVLAGQVYNLNANLNRIQ